MGLPSGARSELGPDPRPLSLRIHKRSPAGLTTRPSGYQAVGMRPMTAERFGPGAVAGSEPAGVVGAGGPTLAGSMSATELRPPSATKRTWPSGDHAKAFG